MAVLNAVEILGSRSASANMSETAFSERTYKRLFLVQCSVATDGPITATSAAGLPALYDAYSAGAETDTKARCTEITAEPVTGGEGFYWRVTATYSTKPIGQGNSGGQGTVSTPSAVQDRDTAPTSRNWIIKFGSEKSTRPLFPKDLANVEVKNSAGQFFDPPIEIPCSKPTIQITAYSNASLTTLYGKVSTFTDAINSDVFLGFAAKTLRCTEYQVTTQFENGAYFCQLDITLLVDKNGWNPVKVVDAGTMYVASSPGTDPLQPIIDKKTGSPVTSAVPLNGTGQVLAPGAALVYKDFTGYTELTFVGNLIV